MRTYFENIVAEMRGEGLIPTEAEQQNTKEDLRQPTSDEQPHRKEPVPVTSEAKPRDKQVNKDLTSEAKRKIPIATSEAKPRDTEVDKDLTSKAKPNGTPKTTSEAKPRDKKVNKDLTSEAEPKENLSKATAKAAPEQKKDLCEKLTTKAKIDLNTYEAKGRTHKLPGGLQQLSKIETKPDIPKFSWAERSAQRARSNEIKVKLQFFMEAVTFDANTPDKERGNLHRTPQFVDVIKESPGFHNKQLF